MAPSEGRVMREAPAALLPEGVLSSDKPTLFPAAKEP